MTNNLNEPTIPEANPIMATPIETESVKTDGYNEAVKQGNSTKVLLLVVIVLIFGVLVAYILMRYLGGENTGTVTPTVIPSITSIDEDGEPTDMPSSDENNVREFYSPVKISDYPEIDYIVSSLAPKDAELIPYQDDGVSRFVIRGNGYELSVEPFSAGSENISYEDYVFLMNKGADTIARIKETFLGTPQHQYRYVRSDLINETENCGGIAEDTSLTAPCGPTLYVSGNEVETFYVLDITCDADAENVSKCDEIVKSLEVQY
jgi:hypothetical protein